MSGPHPATAPAPANVRRAAFVAGIAITVGVVAWAVVGSVRDGSGALVISAWPFAACVLVAASWTAVAGLAGLSFLLRLPWTPCAVAHALLVEAWRRRVALTTGAVLYAGIAAIALSGRAEDLPHYRLKSFLTYSFELTAVLVSVMTLLFGCGTLSTEVDRLHVFVTLVKPVRRGSFILGKWLGVFLVDGLILAIAGLTIATFAGRLAAEGQADPASARIIAEEVLVAREEVAPVPETPLEERVRREGTMGPVVPGSSSDAEEEMAERLHIARSDWLTVGPGEEEVYVFAGMPADARASNAQLVVRINLSYGSRRAASDVSVRLRFDIDGRVEERAVIKDQILRFPLRDTPGAVATGANAPGAGGLRVAIRNSDASSPALFLTGGHAIEVVMRTGGFAGNLTRAFAMLWIKLGFLAALALGAATFLGFPVAALAAVILAAVAASSSFVLERERPHVHGPPRPVETEVRADLALRQRILKGLERVGDRLATVMLPFSRYAPVAQLADGRSVPPRDLAACALTIGAGWTGVMLLLGIVIFRRRELARIQL